MLVIFDSKGMDGVSRRRRAALGVVMLDIEKRVSSISGDSRSGSQLIDLIYHRK